MLKKSEKYEILPFDKLPCKKLRTVVRLCRGKENVWKFAWKYEARLIKNKGGEFRFYFVLSEVNSIYIHIIHI